MTISKDGGALNDQPPADGGESEPKPAWSTRSLRDLKEAVRRGRRFDDAWRLRQKAERIAGEATRAMRAYRAYEDKAAEGAI
jgi:hypothetical protein